MARPDAAVGRGDGSQASAPASCSDSFYIQSMFGGGLQNAANYFAIRRTSEEEADLVEELLLNLLFQFVP